MSVDQSTTEWSFSWSWLTEATTEPNSEVSLYADVTYGSILFLSFLIGTLGNIASFLYFKSKKRDISNVIYMLTTVNDIVASVAVLPVVYPYLSQRRPGISAF